MSARRARKLKNAPDLPIDVYLRISLDPENDEEGVRRQERICRKYVQDRGLKIGKVFVDNDKSARGPLPERDKLYERIKNGESGGVVCYHIKRLLRRVVDMESLIDLIDATDARVIGIESSELDLTTASGRAVGRILAAMGEMELDEISERMQSYFYDRATQGKPHKRGRRPFGYNEDWTTLHTKATYEKDKDGTERRYPPEAPAYKELFQLVIKGYSLSQVATLWEKKGILDRNGNRFSVANIRSLIVSPRAVGAVRSRGEILEGVIGQWEPITDKPTQDAALAALKSRRTHLRRSTGVQKRGAQLLSSFMVCDDCGTPLRVELSGKKLTYACDKASRRGCGRVRLVVDHADKEVAVRFLAVLTDPKTHKSLEKIRRQAPDTSAISDEIKRLHHELETIQADKDNDEISYADWKRLTKATRARLDTASAKLTDAGEQPALLAMPPEQVVKRWPRMNADERRHILRLWVNEIRVEPLNGKGGRNFRPERIKVAWRV
jgi:DNA invertase Pin-like site-specific DNA recombinase